MTDNKYNAAITRANDLLSKPITLQTANAECNSIVLIALLYEPCFRSDKLGKELIYQDLL
ncbi:hypothetical protein ERW51_18180 [Aliivibrio finisterrensis]|nr:hypothetical protein ERW54_18755 [Aliivibrio finisterrensis]RYU67065.1 hypothetical protein ERW51_18180 [Aliivibrio finisterrensis]RYU70168.1 hypothetical protein ERW48_18580 [Aliivibrio finisterrensis]